MIFMKQRIIQASLMAVLMGMPGQTPAAAPASLINSGPDQQIVVNNRILAKVNGKAISVIDIMKKMDMTFYKQFPQYANSVQARYQFYMTNWKPVLGEMIDKELILADASEAKITITQGDIRQELEELFGPNIIVNLDKAGLTLDEASQLVLADITIRRMMYFRVHSLALNKVTPQVIRTYYDEVAKDHIRDNEWTYSMVSIRHRNPTKAAELANYAHHLLIDEKVPMTDLAAKVQDPNADPKQPVLTVSEEYHTKEKDLSESFRTILKTLQPDSYTAPIAQKSRAGGGSVFRIFYLKSMKEGGVVPFAELEPKIKAKLLDDEVTRESEIYLRKLRKQFNVQETQLKELLSSDFQPFVLK
jgi:hypothetical protein